MLQAGFAPPASWTFPRKVTLVAFVGVLLVLAWQLLDLFVLAFGAVVVASALGTVAAFLERRVRVPHRWSMPLALLLIVTVLGLVGWWVGDALATQLAGLREKLPAAIAAVRQWLDETKLGATVMQYANGMADDAAPWAKRLAGVAGLTFGALGTAGLMLVMGIYLAASPRLYRDGIVRLTPPAVRGRVDDALQASGDALSRWLMGQAVSMLFVGGATALGLWLLDVPLAFAVGVVAGLLAFIPFFGAIAAGLLSVVLAFMQGPQTALHVVILAVAIQQIEGHLLMPFVQRWAVNLPPVLGLAAAVMFGVLFGVMGVLLATPMMVVLMVLVRKLYVEGVLERRAPVQEAALAG